MFRRARAALIAGAWMVAAGGEAAETPANDAVLAARAAECAATLRLPVGPIDSCRDAIVATAIATTAVVGLVAWWRRGFDTEFDVAHEGWFGANTYAGGIDKLGHAFSFYAGTRLMTRGLGWAGVPHGESLALAGGLALGLGLGIEVLDGLARGGTHGFSWNDMAMNAAGTGLAWLAESRPGFDRWWAFRWRYAPGGDPERSYDRHQYYAVLRLSGWRALGASHPLRYVELLAGYGARGFGGDAPAGTAGSTDDRERSLYVGIGLNLTELLERTAWRGDAAGGRTQRVATEALRYLQVPGTAATTAVRTWRP
jgi:hypothetical protein